MCHQCLVRCLRRSQLADLRFTKSPLVKPHRLHVPLEETGSWKIASRITDAHHVPRHPGLGPEDRVVIRFTVHVKLDLATLGLVSQRNIVPLPIVDAAPGTDLSHPADIKAQSPTPDKECLAIGNPFRLRRGLAENRAILARLDPCIDRVVLALQIKVRSLGHLEIRGSIKLERFPGRRRGRRGRPQFSKQDSLSTCRFLVHDL